MTVRELPAKLATLREMGFAWCFIDTPPALTEQNRQVLGLADIVLIPARPSPNDLWSLGATLDLVKQSGMPFVFVLTQAKGNARITVQTMAALSGHGKVFEAVVHDRVDYAASMTDGRTAFEIAPTGPAAAETAQLLGRELGPSARGQAGADQDRSQLGEPPLEHVLEGARQKALFSVLSRWAFAYRQQNKVGSDWPARVLTEALDQNARFPDPLSPAEVASTARSVASFRGVGMFDHSPKTQARRGVASAKVRRFLVYARDLAMVARLDAGDSQRVVGRAFNVSQRTARNARARLALPRRAPRGLAR